jgi:hypothetical protein
LIAFLEISLSTKSYEGREISEKQSTKSYDGREISEKQSTKS